MFKSSWGGFVSTEYTEASAGTVHDEIIRTVETVHNGVGRVRTVETVHNGVGRVRTVETVHNGVGRVRTVETVHNGVGRVRTVVDIHHSVVVDVEAVDTNLPYTCVCRRACTDCFFRSSYHNVVDNPLLTAHQLIDFDSRMCLFFSTSNRSRAHWYAFCSLLPSAGS